MPVILKIVVVLLIVGFLLWLTNRYLPLEPAIRNILLFIVIVAVLYWILKVLGVLAWLGTMG